MTIYHPAFVEAEASVRKQINRFLQANGHLSTDYFHKTLGKLLYDKCGLSKTKQSLEAAIVEIKLLKKIV